MQSPPEFLSPHHQSFFIRRRSDAKYLVGDFAGCVPPPAAESRSFLDHAGLLVLSVPVERVANLVVELSDLSASSTQRHCERDHYT